MTKASIFYNELQQSLPSATGPQLKAMAAAILKNKVPLESLFPLLKEEAKTATHFLWLLSDIGLQEKSYLFTALPSLLVYIKTCNSKYQANMSNYWRIAGVPIENEGEAIDLLFQFVLSNAVVPSIKVRAFEVLLRLCKKYPDMKQELKICLEAQRERYTVDFGKRVGKMLEGL